MKIFIKNKKSVILANIFKATTFITVGGLFILFLFLGVFFSLAYNISNTLSVILVFLPSILYVLFIFVDTKMYAEGSSIELKENSIELTFKNLFNQGHVVIPLSQLESANIFQPFLHKLLGICFIRFIQESGAAAVTWGYSYQDASEFVRKVGEKHKIRISN